MIRYVTYCAVVVFGCGHEKLADNTVKIGVVLPFSGERAAVGSNIEKAMIFAVEAINQGGGIAGRPISLDVADSHSDPKRAFAAATQLIENDHVQILIGPEESTATLDLVASVVEHDLIQMQAALTSPAIVGPNALLGYWYRLTPDATTTGAALAARAHADGITKSTVLFDNDDYNIDLNLAYTNAFQALGGANVPDVPFVPGTTDYSDVIASLAGLQVQSVVLPAEPGTAVSIVEQWGIAKNKPFDWYFTPDLKTPLFAENLPTGVADGLIGISPALGDDAAAFSAAYASRWAGENPLDAACFYYDALAVAALAWQAASASGALATNAAIRPQLTAISDTTHPGQVIGFANLADGMKAARAGTPVVYRGVTGPLDFDSSGVAQRGAQTFQFWTIHDRQIAFHE